MHSFFTSLLTRHFTSRFESRSFCDTVRLALKAGNGGSGAHTYFTDKKVRRGAPDGGNGGTGGDIILQAHHGLHDLGHCRRKTIEGNHGKRGGARGMNGKNGGHTVVRVPCGTTVHLYQENKGWEWEQCKGELASADGKLFNDFKDDTLEAKEDGHSSGDQQKKSEIINDQKLGQPQAIKNLRGTKRFVCDLVTSGEKRIIARGGKAGKGNKVFPGIDETLRGGTLGEQVTVYLQLKMLADVGLVGLPNVGKSTFLAAVTRAHPKIANYPFTTLKPSLGYSSFADNFKLSIADLPGIIEGAHQDKGLGLEFLRHIERTRSLLFVLDGTDPSPAQTYRILQQEIIAYNKELGQRVRVVAINKSDLLSGERAAKVLQEVKAEVGDASECFLVSNQNGTGVGDVLLSLRRNVEEKIRQEDAEKVEAQRESIQQKLKRFS